MPITIEDIDRRARRQTWIIVGSIWLGYVIVDVLRAFAIGGVDQCR